MAITVRSITALSNILNAAAKDSLVRLEIFYRKNSVDEVKEVCKALSLNMLCDMKFSECDFQLSDNLIAHINASNNLKGLQLPGNKLTGDCIQKIGDILSKSNSLQALNLCNNSLNDQDLQQLSSSLKNNTSLLSLKLSGNKFTNTGVGHLIESLEDNTTIQEIDLAFNHISADLLGKIDAILTRNIEACDLAGVSGKFVS